MDAATLDAATLDAATIDAATLDAATIDAATIDAATLDAATMDAMMDATHPERRVCHVTPGPPVESLCGEESTRRGSNWGRNMGFFHMGFCVALSLLVALAAAEARAQPLFRDVAAEVGLEFVHHNGMSGRTYFSEMMGPGAALVDVDGDGDLDVFLVQGHDLGAEGGRTDAAHRDRLFRNDIVRGADGKPRLRFTDITAESGLDARGYGMGVATGDYDNDGRVDLYLTNFGDNQLWRNLGVDGDGRVRFVEVTQEARAEDRRWSVSASFADLDRDGWLDLVVANYVDFALAIHKPCRSHTGAPDYCSPLAYAPLPDLLLRNRGKGTGPVTFERSSALAKVPGAGLGVLARDLDGDGWIDLYVANDQDANRLWLNRREFTFVDEALLAGAAVNAEGRPEAGMGVAAGDVDGDGDPDLIVSHLDRETNTLYINEGGGFFEDRTGKSGMATASWDFTGFGLGWIDFDNDGDLDLAVANGAVRHLEHLVRAEDPFPLHQRNQLFENLGGGRFADATERAGPAFALSEVSRGLAVGDVDNDGDADLLVANNNGSVRLLRNEVGQKAPWLGLRCITTSGRDALGAQVVLERGEAPPLVRLVSTDGSYASASDPRVLFGLGGSPPVTGLNVTWPEGRVERFPVPETGRYHTLRQGAGTAQPETKP